MSRVSYLSQGTAAPAVRRNWLDTAIGFVAPEAALRRVAARTRLDWLERSAFDGARQDHRAASWRVEPAGPNLGLYSDIVALRNRARSLVRNNPMAKRSINILTAHTVGCGIRPSWKTDSKAQRARLQSAWDRFVDNADARGQVDFYGLQEQAARAMFEAGEVLSLRDVRRNARAPLSYLLLESEQLDHNREGVWDGRPTRLGVALGQNQHAVEGYWLFDYFPGDQVLWGVSPVSKFTPKDGVCHLYRIRRPGQVRGVPELAASLSILRDYADFQEAALVKAKIEACFGAFITSEDGATGNLGTRAGTDGDPNTYGEMTPGMMARLRTGESVTFAQPSTTSDFSSFTIHSYMDAAAGLGVTYDQATGDLRQANYSSLRAGKIEFRREIEMLQHLTFVRMFCKPHYADFLGMARSLGELRPSDELVPVEWITPAWEPIDPIKDLQADILAVRSGRMTMQQFIASWGQDPHEQVAEIAAFNKLLDENEIVLDTDPRKVSAGGQAQPPDPGDTPDTTGPKPAKK